MEKIKIGIITCSNTTRILDCPVSVCLKDMEERKGFFKEYKDKKIELVGISSCNGCPTVVGESVIIPKVESLVHYGADYIHLSYCMMVLCPFKNKYIKIIKKHFPKINLVPGTHKPHQTDDEFRCEIEKMLKNRRSTIIP